MPRLPKTLSRAMLSAAAIVVALSSAGTLLASSEHLSFAHDPDGSVLITLSGALPYCGTPAAVPRPPQLTITGNQIALISTIVMGECPPPPPGFIPPVPQPYAVTINAGLVPDGTYGVTWSFAEVHQATRPIEAFTSSFTQVAAAAPSAIPVFAPPVLALMALALGLLGMVALRR